MTFYHPPPGRGGVVQAQFMKLCSRNRDRGACFFMCIDPLTAFSDKYGCVALNALLTFRIGSFSSENGLLKVDNKSAKIADFVSLVASDMVRKCQGKL